MDGTPRDQESFDRHFDFTKVPLTAAAKQLAIDFIAEAGLGERRIRGRRAEDLRRHEAAVSALAMDLAHRSLFAPGQWLSVSLEKAQYTPAMRQVFFQTEQFPELVKQLASQGLVELRLGAVGLFGQAGRRSAIRAGAWLLDRIEALELEPADIARNWRTRKDLIVLRSSKVEGTARDLVIHDTPLTRRLRGEMETINEVLAAADLRWEGDEVEAGVDIQDRFVRRIFNKASFEQGGRLNGGFWQRAKSEGRVDAIFFGDDPAVELDFGQISIRIAYSLVNAVPPPGDLYQIPGLEEYRAETKKVLNALIARHSKSGRLPAGTRGRIPRSYKGGEVIAAIGQHHPALVPLFGTGLALTLQHIESQILIAILQKLNARGIVALPIHDCVIVAEQHHLFAKQIMESTFKEMRGVEGTVEVTLSQDSVTTTVSPALPLKKGA